MEIREQNQLQLQIQQPLRSRRFALKCLNCNIVFEPIEPKDNCPECRNRPQIKLLI